MIFIDSIRIKNWSYKKRMLEKTIENQYALKKSITELSHEQKYIDTNFRLVCSLLVKNRGPNFRYHKKLVRNKMIST